MTIEEFFDIVDGIQPDEKGCKIWPKGCTGKGYAYVSIGGKPNSGHRAVLKRKLGRAIAPGLQALHTCDVRNCVSENHIYEGTPLQNMLDKEERGRGNHTSKITHPHVGFQKKITVEQELRVLELAKTMSHHQISSMVGLHQTTISRIVRRYS